MSNKLRNPFRMRASEKIESDAIFLRLYSPTILDTLLDNHSRSTLWNNVTYIYSSPGGGKTSLLRIFEPTVLRHVLSSQSHYKEIFTILNKLDVFRENDLKVLGIYLLCSRSFEMLDDINIPLIHKRRLFFSLLNSRVIIATLKCILLYKNMKFPDQLKDICFNYNDLNNYFQNLKTPCNGQDLYDWASIAEKKIFSAIDSLIPIKESSIPGHDELFGFTIMSSEFFSIEQQQICERFLFMIDDAHKFTSGQRNIIKEELIEKRGCYTLWIAERIEALEPKHYLDKNNIIERDFQIINIEDFFRGKDSRFSTLISTVAEKRALLSSDNLNTFQDHLSEEFSEEKYHENYLKSIENSKLFFSKIKQSTNKYNVWLDFIENQECSARELSVLMKQTEIIIWRNLNNRQLTLDFGLQLEELNQQLGGEIRTAALYFVHKNFKIPYYFGFPDITKLSSCNIEQFLSFSADLFEGMLSNKLLGNSTTLTIEEQEKVIRNIVFNKWKSLSTGLPYSGYVIKFLNKLGNFCFEETNKPNAPYAPGVSGFAIKESNKGLFNEKPWFDDNNFETLFNVISTCVAFNIFEVKQTNQGKKGQIWTVYYLNRWLCVHYNLPLFYGGWRSKSPIELFKWLK